MVILSEDELEDIVTHTSPNWAVDDGWKYNSLFLRPPYDMQHVVEAIRTLKPDIEILVPGHGVLYQAMSKKLFGVTTTGKLASNPIYKIMTVRNHNTTTALLRLAQ